MQDRSSWRYLRRSTYRGCLLMPEFAVYRHLRTRDPCIDGISLPKKLKIHRYMH